MELLWRLHPEPTLCFDGDNAGMRAAARAIERALPLLKPGKSFRFAIVTGGKDPDDVLREQGAAALRAQLTVTTPFVDALFTKERELEPLDTPEHRAGLKQRLRGAANTIADKDLAQAYRDELLKRFDALFSAGQPQRAQTPWQRRPAGRWRGREELLPSTMEGKAAAKRLSGAVDPVTAAVAKGALDDPPRLDEHLEELEAYGFGDPLLSELAKEIIHLRLGADHLDTEGLARHLRAQGYAGLLTDIDRAASQSGAPFLKQDVTLAAARSEWSHAFAVLTRVAALERALDTAKRDLAEGASASALMRLKTERDKLRRAIKTGTIWTDDGSL
jgi:DNA primase